MPISAMCPSCQARVKLPDNAAGRRFRCPQCKGVIPGEAVAPPIVANITPPFIDEASEPTESHLDDRPAPISALAQQALRDEYNPFDDGTPDEEEGLAAKKKRYWQPKDDYNPFAEPPPPTLPDANPEQIFDFGVAENSGSTPATNDLDFGSANDEESPRRRRR